MLTTDPQVAEWARIKIGKIESWMGDFKVIGATHNGDLFGAVVYDGFTPFECNMHVIVENSRYLTRSCIIAAFSYPFVQLGLRRVTGLIPSTNLASLQFAQRLGFVIEGVKRSATPDGDEIILGVTRENCRWLK